MNRLLPPALLALLLCGCMTKTVTTTHASRPDVNTGAYNQFIDQRARELQLMGGPFTKPGVAESKAIAEAKARYGGVPGGISSSWSWGREAARAEDRAKLADELDKMARDSGPR